MTTTTYTIEHDERGYYVTDGIWRSSPYKSKATAHQVMRDASWGERGGDGRGTHADKRAGQ